MAAEPATPAEGGRDAGLSSFNQAASFGDVHDMAVPHFYQSSEQTCGAACLRMLLADLGKSVDESTIAQSCATTPLGATAQDLEAGAKALGMEAELLPVSDETAANDALSKSVPFVAMIDLAELQGGPMLQWHFVVALGLTNDEVEYHDPADGPNQRASLEEFLAAWATAGYRGVRVWTP